MLGFLRRNKNNPIIVFLLVLAVALMVGFGVSMKGNRSTEWAAKVDGEVILDVDYASSYSNAFKNRQREDRGYDRTKAEHDKLREVVMNQLVTFKILAREARAEGLEVDDQSLKDAILEDPKFQLAGRFDKDLYERVLASYQISDLKYEQQERERLLAEKYLTAFRGMMASEAEAREAFEHDQKKLNVEFVAIQKKDYENNVGTVTMADAEAFKAKPEAEEQIQKFYTKNKSTRFDVAERVCASHILLRADKATPPDLRETAKKSIEEAAKAIKGGLDFSAAAKKFSEDANKDKGGDLGCFAQGQTLPQLEDVAFALKPGEVSGVVESPFGFHIIKVTERKEPIRKKLEDVKDEIALELVKTVKAGEMAKAKAAEVLAAASGKPSLSAAVGDLNKKGSPTLVADETGPFRQGQDFLPKLGMAKEVTEVAWKLTSEQPLADRPLETDHAFVVVRLKDRIQPTEAEWEQSRVSILASLTMKKQTSAFEGWQKALKARHSVETNPIALSYDESVRAQHRRQVD